MLNNIKEKILAYANGITGSLGFLSGYQVCHNVCLSVIALLSFFGITIGFLPFLFLQQYNLLFWSAALAMLAISLILYRLKPHCMSRHAIVFNAGILIAAIPFKEVEFFQIGFWSIGAIIIGVAFWTWRNDRKLKRGGN